MACIFPSSYFFLDKSVYLIASMTFKLWTFYFYCFYFYSGDCVGFVAGAPHNDQVWHRQHSRFVRPQGRPEHGPPQPRGLLLIKKSTRFSRCLASAGVSVFVIYNYLLDKNHIRDAIIFILVFFHAERLSFFFKCKNVFHNTITNCQNLAAFAAYDTWITQASLHTARVWVTGPKWVCPT